MLSDDVVAALALEREPRLGGARAQLHPGDVVAAGAPQVAQVLAAREAGVHDPHAAPELPAAEVVLDLLDHGLV
jgi:hypothetical protein